MLPLKDKTVLITRSANQAAAFINQLKDLGAKTITLPLIEIKPINQNELTGKLNSSNYDWIIFTSANSVRFFFESISPEKVTSKIAAVGTKTEQVLKDLGVEVDFTPSQFTAKHLANEIPIATNNMVLIPRSNLAKNDIVEILETRGCIVEPIPIYQNSSIEYSKKELNNIFQQKVDFITFTSGSTVNSFIELGIELNQEKIVCIGPETAKVAEQNNLKVTSIASPHTTEGMIKALTSLN